MSSATTRLGVRRPTPAPQQQQQRWELPDAAFVRGAGAADTKKGGAASNHDGDDGRHHHHHNQAVQSAAARERRRRISNKTAELSRLIPGAARMNSTAEMLQAAARHVRLLQAQVGMLALMHSSAEARAPSMAASQEHHQMRALLASGGVQERLAGEGRCLVPTRLVHAIADDDAMANSNPALSRDVNRFKNSLEQ
uniref:BHLH domain-containing protein n=1 Tax=Oryza punctata TaxID=4537 RepID=A0A0E0MMM8_ORYPU